MSKYRLFSISVRSHALGYLVTEIGRKLNIRSCPKMHFIRRVSIRHPMTSTTFNEIFGSLATKEARKKGAFETTRSELDRIFPNGWAERSFKTSTKCIVSPKEPVRISFKTERRIDYNHSTCPRCTWDGVASKPQQCNPKRGGVQNRDRRVILHKICHFHPFLKSELSTKKNYGVSPLQPVSLVSLLL